METPDDIRIGVSITGIENGVFLHFQGGMMETKPKYFESLDVLLENLVDEIKQYKEKCKEAYREMRVEKAQMGGFTPGGLAPERFR